MKLRLCCLLAWLVMNNQLSTRLAGEGPAVRHQAKPDVVKSQHLTQHNVSELIVAIEDEVYDYGLQKSFYRIGITTGPLAQALTKLTVYVRPFIDKNGAGEAIYKDMPYGEVLRVFHIRVDGVVVLDNDPELGFPMTEPSHLTLFMDDDELCKNKRTWLRESFLIEDNPSRTRVEEASNRQKERVGFSNWQYKHSSDKPVNMK